MASSEFDCFYPMNVTVASAELVQQLKEGCSSAFNRVFCCGSTCLSGMGDESHRVLMVSKQDIKDLLERFSATTYRPQDDCKVNTQILEKCLELFKLDYEVTNVANTNGELSGTYPATLFYPEYEIPTGSSQRTTDTIYESVLDTSKLRDMILKARTARCRTRFPLPVILYKGKYICRSGTLSGGPEIYGRSSYDFFFNIDYEEASGPSTSTQPVGEVSQSDWLLFNRVRNADIKMLKALNVTTIVDLMVEKKKVKFGMNVTSSEKVDKENRYSDFVLISLPYPGCEFFKDYKDNNCNAKGIVFNWQQSFVDANLWVPDEQPTNVHFNWQDYKSWDLETITKNYLKYLLKYIHENNSGILIHCISGWDRTPLFISLIRLSLWADGLIHQSLDCNQIIYFTIAYDWYLFGHNLPDRLSKGEEIMYFCFDMLTKIIGDEYSLGRKVKVTARTDAESPEVMSEMENICEYVGPALMVDELGNLTNNANQLVLNEPGTSSATRSPLSRRTSPVSVPLSKLRQKHDSTSSLGSWHIVNSAGSIREFDDSKELNANDCASVHTMPDEDAVMTYQLEGYAYREIRLNNARKLFRDAYAAKIGYSYKTNESRVQALLGNIATAFSTNPN